MIEEVLKLSLRRLSSSKEQMDARRKAEMRRALKILRKRQLTGPHVLTDMKSDGEAALLQKPGVQGQGGNFIEYSEELLCYRSCADRILKCTW